MTARPAPAPAPGGRLLLGGQLAGVGLALGLLGPFGTYFAMPLPVRLVHFLANCLVIGGMIVIAGWAVRRFLFRGPMPIWAALAVALAFAPLGAVVVRLHLWLLAPHVLPHVAWSDLVAQTAVINVLASLVAWLLERREAPRSEIAPASAAPPLPVTQAGADALRDRMPAALRHTPILALSAEDHYLRVHTARGEALVFMSLSGGMEALGEGIRVHRSHWVARQALLDGTARVGRAGIVVAGGPAVPVSRSGRRRLSAEGFA